MVALCKKDAETQSYILLNIPYAGDFWAYILSIFNWNMVLPMDLKYQCYYALTGHPLKNVKKFMWIHFIKEFLHTRKIMENNLSYN